MNIKELLTELGYTSNDPDENVRNALTELIGIRKDIDALEYEIWLLEDMLNEVNDD